MATIKGNKKKILLKKSFVLKVHGAMKYVYIYINGRGGEATVTEKGRGGNNRRWWYTRKGTASVTVIIDPVRRHSITPMLGST